MNGDQPQDYPPAKAWMKEAANDIDIKLGLPRSDLAIEWCAKIIARHYENHLDLTQLIEENASAHRARAVALAANEIAEALAEETRRNATAPSREDMEQAVVILARSDRGRATMQGVLSLLDEHALGLDYHGQNAVLTVLRAAWGPYAGSARDLMRDTLQTQTTKNVAQ